MNMFFTLITATIIGATGSLQPASSKHVLIHGSTVEQVYNTDNVANAPEVWVIINRDDEELYCAFKTDSKGEYEFNLPVGHRYELLYGGEDFVNKKVIIDATDTPEVRRGHTVKMNMSLFRPIEQVDYSVLENPLAEFKYDKMSKSLSPDMIQVEDMLFAIDKVYRKSEKAARKKN
jgi:hypothetical protein